VIPLQLEDICDFGDATVDNAIRRLIEVFRDEIGQEGRDSEADLGQFEHGRASGGYCADEWLEGEKNGEIPGSGVQR